MGSLKGKKIAVFAEQDFEDLELFYPKIRLEEEGATVEVLGWDKDSYQGKNGLTIEVDGSAKGAKAKDFDGLVIPGGFSPDHMRRHKGMVKFVQALHKAGKPIAAICHGPWLLAEADVLKGVKVTSFPSVRRDLENAGAAWEDAEVVCSKHIVTSRTPEDLGAFCKAFIRELTTG